MGGVFQTFQDSGAQMTLKKIDHIGIAVEDLKQATKIYEILTGKKPDHVEEVPSEKVKAAFFSVGESHLELLEATSEESPIAKFISKRGKGGIHHICIEVDDIKKKLAELKKNGIQLIDEKPKQGAHGKLVAFVHPNSTGGVLIELSGFDYRGRRTISG